MACVNRPLDIDSYSLLVRKQKTDTPFSHHTLSVPAGDPQMPSLSFLDKYIASVSKQNDCLK